MRAHGRPGHPQHRQQRDAIHVGASALLQLLRPFGLSFARWVVRTGSDYRGSTEWRIWQYGQNSREFAEKSSRHQWHYTIRGWFVRSDAWSGVPSAVEHADKRAAQLCLLTYLGVVAVRAASEAVTVIEYLSVHFDVDFPSARRQCRSLGRKPSRQWTPPTSSVRVPLLGRTATPPQELDRATPGRRRKPTPPAKHLP